ncbi:MAG: Ku protein [Reyranella sp.]|nr:Ku protein [Reyranella sp.]MBL6653061.1 Ku protein [Reyranella sp.]
MARSSWKGYLKLSLVSCAVALYNASSASERVSFNTLNRKTGNRLKQNMVDSVTGEPVDTADRVKGYQVSKGQYVMVEDEEIEALKLESTKTIEIETFVPAAEIDEIYLDSPYYLAPDDKVAEEAFAVIREAMTRKKMVGIGRIVLARRERMLMLQPRDKGMLATTLRYPYEVRAGSEIFDEISDVKLPGEMLDIAQEIINRMSGHFEPETFTDRYEEAVVSMLKAKQAGQTFTVPEPSQPANVVNIMDALKKSLEAAGGEGALRRPRAPSKKAEAPAAKEKETARKPVAKKPAARKAARG